MLTKKTNSVSETKEKNVKQDSTAPLKTAKNQKPISNAFSSHPNTNHNNSSLADSALKKASSTSTNQTYTFQDFYKKNDSENSNNKNIKTKITLKCDIGYNNQLFIRGQGANLSWTKGTLLKNIQADEWIWETTISFSECEFKVLLNDVVYEIGANHQIHEGANITYTPHFPS